MITLSGKELSENIQDNLKNVVSDLKENGQNVKLSVVQVGKDKASSVYINQKKKACDKVGIEFDLHHLYDCNDEEDVVSLVEKLNEDDSVTAMMVQLPLPDGMNSRKIMSHIAPGKDADGLSPCNVGNLVLGNRDSSVIPCTAYGIMTLLEYNDIDIAGRNCVVVGRSDIVGKPVSMLMTQADATVTLCHSKTKNLKEVCKRADILICSIGSPKFFDKEYVKDGAVIIDVGINRMDDGSLCGDVDFDDVKDIAGAITPVPGGVGLLTVSMLMSNCVELAMRS